MKIETFLIEKKKKKSFLLKLVSCSTCNKIEVYSYRESSILNSLTDTNTFTGQFQFLRNFTLLFNTFLKKKNKTSLFNKATD